MKTIRFDIQQEKAPSDEFIDAFLDSGTLVGDCYCGRVHYATHETRGYYDEGELENLEKKTAEDPTAYIPQDCSSISQGEIFGRNFVFSCPCNWASKYEDIIISNRRLISKFLLARAARIAKDSQNENEIAAPLKTIS